MRARRLKTPTAAVLILVMTFFAHPSALSAEPNRLPNAVKGLVERYKLFFESINDRCSPESAKSAKHNISIMVSGVFVCKSKYRTDRTFIEGYYQGKKYVFEENAIQIKPDELTLLKSLSSEERTSYAEAVARLSQEDFSSDLNKANEKFDKIKSTGFVVLSWKPVSPNSYIDSVDIAIKVLNSSSKVVKYVAFNFAGFNPVDDPVLAHGKRVATLTGVGPIQPEKSGEYYFKYVWMSNTFDSAKLLSIKLTYTDGTTKVISDPSSISLSRDEYDLLFKDDLM